MSEAWIRFLKMPLSVSVACLRSHFFTLTVSVGMRVVGKGSWKEREVGKF